MFDKKIILLISILLVTGSSYFIFHRKKDNNDEVNIVDNSDNSINDDANEEESVNDAESSSSLLLVIIIIIVIIIIAAAIFFFIFYRRNKKVEKVEEEKKPDSPEELAFWEYNKFKEVEANEKKIASEIQQQNTKMTVLVNTFECLARNLYNNLIGNKKINPNDYVEKEYIIDFFYPFANGELKKHYKKNNKTVFRFNFTEYKEFFKSGIPLFFSLDHLSTAEEYKNENFKNLNDDNKKEAMFLFIATVIEPFFAYMYKIDRSNNGNKVYFVKPKDKNLVLLKSIFAEVALQKNEKTKGMCDFITYVLGSESFASIFSQLIKKHSPFDFVFEKNEVIVIKNNN